MNYRTLMWGCIALAATSWATVTGLSVEKMLVEGVQSWTLFLAMPVFVAAVAFLIHLAVESTRDGRLIRGIIAAGLACLTLWVTLPNSIGSTGSAKDAEVAQAQASNRGLAFSTSLLTAAQNDLADAKAKSMTECLGAPEVIPVGTWPKCQWWRRQVDAHTLAVEKYGKGVADAPVEKTALSGEKRIATALSSLGSIVPEAYRFEVTEANLLVWLPIAPPLAGELLCAFFGYMALEFRRLAAEAKKVLAASVTPRIEVPAAAPAIGPWQTTVAPTQATAPFFIEETEPTPPKGGKKPSRQQKRKETGLMKLRARTLAGEKPNLRLIMGLHKVSKSTACRWRKQAQIMAEADAA